MFCIQLTTFVQKKYFFKRWCIQIRIYTWNCSPGNKSLIPVLLQLDIRESSQSPQDESLFLKKLPNQNTKFWPPQSWSQENHFVKSFQNCNNTLCENCMVWSSTNSLQMHFFVLPISKIQLCLFAVLALVLCTKNWNHIKTGVSFVDFAIYHYFRDPSIVQPLFDLESQSIWEGQNFWISDSLAVCFFTQLFHHISKLRRKHMGTAITQPPKQILLSPRTRLAMKDTVHTFLFVKRSFYMKSA